MMTKLLKEKGNLALKSGLLNTRLDSTLYRNSTYHGLQKWNLVLI